MKADNLHRLSYADLAPEELRILQEAEQAVNSQRADAPVYFIVLSQGEPDS